jgi:hypothetical protein
MTPRSPAPGFVAVARKVIPNPRPRNRDAPRTAVERDAPGKALVVSRQGETRQESLPTGGRAGRIGGWRDVDLSYSQPVECPKPRGSDLP